MIETPACKICAHETIGIGKFHGSFRRRPYQFARCPSCDYVFVLDPDTDFDTIYDRDYYLGKGADPLVNYAEDLKLGQGSIKFYEARGLEAWVNSCRRASGPRDTNGKARWLDFGCGTGFLSEYLADRWDAWGYDSGAGTAFAIERGIPLVSSDSELDRLSATFDVVSCIEVLEHLPDPMSVLRRIFELLRPGGLFVYTTGNNAPYLNDLFRWRYVIPEIHISFFSDKTSKIALQRVGFRPEDSFWGAGRTDIYRYKILRNLKVHRRFAGEKIFPWPVVARLADAHFKLSHHPAAWKPLS